MTLTPKVFANFKVSVIFQNLLSFSKTKNLSISFSFFKLAINILIDFSLFS